MSNRRVRLSSLVATATKIIANRILGLAGEDFDGEVYQPYGISANPTTRGPRTINLEINGDPDNHISLPPAGNRLAPAGTTEIYHGNTVIRIDGATNIVTIEAADLIVNGVSFMQHVHTGVQNGGSLSGPPNA